MRLQKINRSDILVYAIIAVVITITLIISYTSVLHENYTVDETYHFEYGQHILVGESDRFDNSKMPITVLNALPQKLGIILGNPTLAERLNRIPIRRLVTMLFSAVVAIYVFRWARELYGKWAGLAALTVYCFEPNILAHARLVTTDIYATGTILIATYYFWRLVNKGGRKNAVFAAVSFGVAQIAKYTAVYLLPIFAIILAIRIFYLVRKRGLASLRQLLPRGVAAFGLFIVVTLFIINAAFIFNRSFTALGAYTFRSPQFQTLAKRFPMLRVPLPYPYVQGLDWVYSDNQLGWPVYLLGTLQYHGFLGYFFVAMLYKVPLAVIAFWLLGVIFTVVRRKSFQFLENELFLIVPAVFFLIYFNYFFNYDLGIRYMLVAFPFLIIFASKLFRAAPRFSLFGKLLTGVLAAYFLVSSLSYYPHFISYFNELVPDKRLAYRVLADSNLDWWDTGYYVQQYLNSHPTCRTDFSGPTSGCLVISTNNLIGVNINVGPKKYAWLRENFTPIDVIAYSHLVFNISPEDLARFKLL